MKIKAIFQRIWPVLLIFLLILVFFWKFFLKGHLPFPGDIIVGLYFPYLDYQWGTTTGIPVKNPLLSDIPSLLYPWRSLVIDQLKSFRLPLWNPFYYLGMPLLANFQSATFNLGNLFFFFLDKPIAWSLGVICQPIITLALTYLYLRSKHPFGNKQNLSKLASFFGASVFAFGGFSVAWLEFNVLGWTAAFLPLHLLLIDKIFQEKKTVYGYFLALSLTLQIFSGYLPIVIYSGIIIFIYLLYLSFCEGIGKSFPALKLVIGAGFLAFFLSAVQVLPGVELVRLSVRSVDPVASESSGGFFPWQNLATFLAPDYFGNPATYNFWGRPFYDNFFGFVGIPALFLGLIVFNLNLKKPKISSFWSLILAISLILITKNPVSLFLGKINFLGLKGGVSARGLFMTDFSLAVLSALGLENLLFGRKDRKFFRRLVVWLVVLGFLVSCLWYLSLGKVNLGFTDPRQHTVAARNLILPTAIFWGLIFLVTGSWFFQRNQPLTYLTGFCLLGLSLFSCFYQANKYLSFSKKEYLFPETPVITFLKNQKGPFRIEPNDVLPQNFWLPYGLEAVSGYDALLPLRTGEFLTAIEKREIQKKISRVNLLANYSSPLFRLLNVRFILVKKRTFDDRFSPEGRFLPQYTQNPRLKLVFEDKTIGVFEDLESLPRAWLVDDYIVENQKAKIIERLSSPEFDPEKTVVLEERPDQFSVSPDQENLISQKEVEVISFQPEKNVYRVRSRAGGILFESAAFYPGWKVFVDGQEAKLFRANYVFRAVFVPPGVHEVKFSYQPRSVLVGLVFSCLAFIYLFGNLARKRLSY